MNNKPLISIKNLSKTYNVSSGYIFSKKLGSIKAVNKVSFDINRGETFGLVGESGCGKTTVGRLITRLVDADEGEIIYRGENILTNKGEELRSFRRDIQMIFQDPLSSLNPRMSIYEIISEPLIIHKIVSRKQMKEKAVSLLKETGLDEGYLNRYPHQLSGGQRQRVLIARALSLSPKFLVADEPVSALDVSVQAQIINLLIELGKKREFTCLFISHDLAVVKMISQRLAVMYLGRIVETGSAGEVFNNPFHPYTKGLVESIPDVYSPSGRKTIQGEAPDPMQIPLGCPFHPRCSYAKDLCLKEPPSLEEKTSGRFAACHYALTKHSVSA